MSAVTERASKRVSESVGEIEAGWDAHSPNVVPDSNSAGSGSDELVYP